MRIGFCGPPVSWFLGGVKGAYSVESGIADVIVSLAVELIRAASDADVDHRARGASILGAVVVGFYAKL